MNLGARASFNRIEDLKDHFKGVDFPVEFALPYRVGDFLSIIDRLDEIRDFVLALQLKVLSVHAPQGNLIADDYHRWAGPSMELSDTVGAESVTFHPNRSRKNRLEGQARVMVHLAELQKDHRALVSVETFGGRDRVLRPHEIRDAGLPMVLDTAHMRENGHILALIKQYHGQIPAVHLSAKGEGEHHLPIDGFCLEVVSFLDEIEWNGSVILEYLPWHHYRIRDDLELLQRFLGGERDIQPLPPDDRYRDDPSKWGFEH